VQAKLLDWTDVNWQYYQDGGYFRPAKFEQL